MNVNNLIYKEFAKNYKFIESYKVLGMILFVGRCDFS